MPLVFSRSGRLTGWPTRSIGSRLMDRMLLGCMIDWQTERMIKRPTDWQAPMFRSEPAGCREETREGKVSFKRRRIAWWEDGAKLTVRLNDKWTYWLRSWLIITDFKGQTKSTAVPNKRVVTKSSKNSSCRHKITFYTLFIAPLVIFLPVTEQRLMIFHFLLF